MSTSPTNRSKKRWASVVVLAVVLLTALLGGLWWRARSVLKQTIHPPTTPQKHKQITPQENKKTSEAPKPPTLPPVDACLNLPDPQSEAPNDLCVNEQGHCVPIPPDARKDEQGHCIPNPSPATKPTERRATPPATQAKRPKAVHKHQQEHHVSVPPTPQKPTDTDDTNVCSGLMCKDEKRVCVPVAEGRHRDHNGNCSSHDERDDKHGDELRRQRYFFECEKNEVAKISCYLKCTRNAVSRQSCFLRYGKTFK